MNLNFCIFVPMEIDRKQYFQSIPHNFHWAMIVFYSTCRDKLEISFKLSVLFSHRLETLAICKNFHSFIFLSFLLTVNLRVWSLDWKSLDISPSNLVMLYFIHTHTVLILFLSQATDEEASDRSFFISLYSVVKDCLVSVKDDNIKITRSDV